MQRAGTLGPAYPEGRGPTGSRTTSPDNRGGAIPRADFALPKPRPRAGPRVSVADEGDPRSPPRPPCRSPALSAAGRAERGACVELPGTRWRCHRPFVCSKQWRTCLPANPAFPPRVSSEVA